MIPQPSSTAEPLLPQVAAGFPPGTMKACIDRHAPLVWTLVRRHLGDSFEAEDLVQEIFTEIWKKASSFDPAIASEVTFIGTIARRRAIDHLRRKARKPDFQPLDALMATPSETPSNPTHGIDSEWLRSTVSQLPEETRMLFKLFFDDGCTHPEIADRTGLPIGTVKTRLRRGLLALRERLAHLGSTPAALQP